VVSDFDETWSLDGKFNFTSTMNQIDHFSSFKFYGAVPESSVYSLLLGLIALTAAATRRGRALDF